MKELTETDIFKKLDETGAKCALFFVRPDTQEVILVNGMDKQVNIATMAHIILQATTELKEKRKMSMDEINNLEIHMITKSRMVTVSEENPEVIESDSEDKPTVH